jgi:hypothetical protein
MLGRRTKREKGEEKKKVRTKEKRKRSPRDYWGFGYVYRSVRTLDEVQTPSNPE